jgi:hypothetical protein
MHAFFAIVFALIGGLITFALGYDYPWPLIVAAIVFLAYFGVIVFIFDVDWD